MPRPKNAVPAKKLTVALPGDLGAKLDLSLYSEAEQRIPFASHQRFLVERIREYFDRDACDLAVYFNDMPPQSMVYGTKATIALLKKVLSEQ